ncbi:MAG TPA: hypothetical protein VNQ90_08175 [Chthoniobacteraceae bacterium]|nr:hypothetical protein [Chthoniobacteraceae bacterium]
MKWLSLSLALLMGVAQTPAWARCRLSRVGTPHGEKFVLENDLVRVEVLGFGGRLHSFRLKKGDAEFLEPIEESFIRHSRLLPPTLISNQAGFTDWFWGERAPEPAPYRTRVVSETDEEIGLEMTGVSGRWKLVRRVTLHNGSRAVAQEITITNAGSAPATLGYWAHLIPNIPRFVNANGESLLFIPGKRGGDLIQGRRTASLPKEGPQEVMTRQSEGFFAIAEPWAAMIAPESGETLLMKSERETFAPDGMLYHWQAGKPGDRRSTLEMIHSPRLLAPAESARYRITLKAFSSRDEVFPSPSTQTAK